MIYEKSLGFSFNLDLQSRYSVRLAKINNEVILSYPVLNFRKSLYAKTYYFIRILETKESFG